jgi:hypothetical protein
MVSVLQSQQMKQPLAFHVEAAKSQGPKLNWAALF